MVLSGCATQFICGPVKDPQTVVGGAHHSMSPYVRLKIAGGVDITVGNESAPQLENDAVIKDFQYGSGDGITATFTIHDQKGGSLTKFVERMLKDYNSATASSVQAEFDYGWITSGCPMPIGFNPSTKRMGTIDSADTNFAEGKFMYQITVSSVAEKMAESTCDKIFGEDGEKSIPIRQALERLMTNSDEPPSVAKVSFKTVKNGQVQDVGFELPTPGDKNGRLDKWVCNHRGKLQTAIEWLGQGSLSQNKKGWYPFYNEQAPGGEIIFWEDNKVICGETGSPQNCIGTYVVNGGKESTVLEFNPSFKWNFNTGTGGGVGGQKVLMHPATRAGKFDGRPDPCDKLRKAAQKGGGQESMAHTSDGMINEFGQEGAEKVERTLHMMARAARYSIHGGAVMCDLVVVGDPSLDPVTHGHGGYVSIIFINPYHMTGSSGGCPEWESKGLEGSPCNELLSNRMWHTNSLGHRITGGKYTTNLRLDLPAPLNDFSEFQPFGGDPIGKTL